MSLREVRKIMIVQYTEVAVIVTEMQATVVV